MNKKRTIIITILVILIVVLSLWISGIIPKQIARISATRYEEKYEQKNDLLNSNVVYDANKESTKENEVNNKVTTIDIQETGLSSKAPPIKYTLNQEEIYTIFSIIDNLTFSKENCDGMVTYFIKYNSEEQEGFITYGIEKFENEYHITSPEKGEAILSNEHQKQLDKIISKMYN